MRPRPTAVFVLLVLLPAGCSFNLNRQRPVDGALSDTDGAVPHDGLSPEQGNDGPTLPDLGPPPTTSMLQTVVNSLTLPEDGTQFAVDLDNDGRKDNRLGDILGVFKLLSPEFDLQQSLDNSLADGDTIILFDLFADELVDSRARTVMLLGEDLDTDPGDNFSGNEPFGLAPESPEDVFLDGWITDGELRATGRVLFPLRYDTFSEEITLESAHVAATVGTTGIGGIVAGAIPREQVEDKLLPLVASRLDELYKDEGTSEDVRADLQRNFDPNGDGTITTAELAGSPAVAVVLSPDVDTNGDNEDDGLSMAAAFTSVGCTIQQK